MQLAIRFTVPLRFKCQNFCGARTYTTNKWNLFAKWNGRRRIWPSMILIIIFNNSAPIPITSKRKENHIFSGAAHVSAFFVAVVILTLTLKVVAFAEQPILIRSVKRRREVYEKCCHSWTSQTCCELSWVLTFSKCCQRR